MNRRDFLAAAGAWWATRFPVPGSRFPNAAKRLGKIGIQLYTVRRELARDVEGTLAKVAAIGFQEVQFSSYPQGTAKSLRAILDRLKLRAPASHVPFQAIRTEWERTLEQAAELGQRYIVVPSVPGNERRTLEDWKRVAGAFNKAGETARKHGLVFGYHNHDTEFVPLEGAIPFDLLLRETDPRLVTIELDLYWITKAGKDPLDYFAQWPGRFPIVHVKDMDATPRQFFADLGTGIIDFRRIFRKASQAGIKHYFYEQDSTPGDPFESARVSYRYLRALKF